MQNNEQALYDAIQPHFACDKRRIKFISHLIMSLLKVATCSLWQWSKAINQPTHRSSRFKRLQRFLASFHFSARLYARLVWAAYGQAPQVVLTLDRTEYQQAGQWVQLLVLGIAYKGMSIPLLWHSANRRGNASAIARASLLRAFRLWLKPTHAQQIILTADREFIGPDMRQAGLIPVIRLRANALVLHRGRPVKVHRLFESTQWRLLRKRRQIYKSQLYLAGLRLASGEYLILMSDHYLPAIAHIYAQRWQIETLFGAFKSRGFHLESCRVSQHRRIRTLLFVLAISLVWAIRTGEWLLEQGQAIALKKLVGEFRQLMSLFRHGLDELQDRLLNYRSMNKLIPLLSCT